MIMSKGRNIKGITIKIGGDTTGLMNSLSGVNKELSSTQAQLKDVERLLKIDPKNTELLKQKYDLLNQSVTSVENKLDALREAERQVQEQFERGEVSAENYNALKREIIETDNKLSSLRAEATKTKNEIDKVDEEPIEEISDAADRAGNSLQEAGKKASNFSDYLKADAIVEGAKGIISSIKDAADETKEYQKIMASLTTASEKAGYTAQETAESYNLLYGYLGDDQTSATTLSNLQKLGLSQSDLTKMVKGTVGAWTEYGDSIPIDSLSESINETAKTAAVTGTFADVLNWAGTSEEEFNQRLADCGSESERTNLILQELANQGLIASADAWRENNSALYDSNEANAHMQEQMSQLGELILPIITSITGKVAELLTWFNSLDSGTQTFILTALMLVAALGPVMSGIQGVSAALSFLAANPIVLLIAAIVGLVALIAVKGDEIQGILQSVDDFMQNIFAKDWTEVFGPVLGDGLNAFMANVKNIWDSIMKIFNGVIDFVRGVFTGDWQRAWDGVKNIFGGTFDLIASMAKAPINGVIGILNGAISGLNILIDGLNKIKFSIPSWVPGIGGKSFGINIGHIGKIPYLAKGGEVLRGSAIVGEAGPELLTVENDRTIVQPLKSNGTTTPVHGNTQIIFNGTYGFNNHDDIDYFMNQAAQRLVMSR